MSALLVGSYVFGALSDMLGRRKAAAIALLVNSVGQLSTAFMPNYASFTLARFITGLGKSPSALCHLINLISKE